MSTHRHKDGLFWPSLFYPSIPQDRDTSETLLQEELSQIRQISCEYDSRILTREMLSLTSLDAYAWHQEAIANAAPVLACERVALKFMLEDTDLAEALLSEEELEKAQATYARKQYNSAALKRLLALFCGLLASQRDKTQNTLRNLFTLPLLEEYRRACAEEAEKSFKPLKRLVDRIAAGVNGACYFHSNDYFNRTPFLPEHLNEYVVGRFGYDYNAALNAAHANSSYLLSMDDQSRLHRRVLQSALLDDPALWEKQEVFDVVEFLKQVEERNGLRHAHKLLDHIFGNLQKVPDARTVLENRLPLYMAEYTFHLQALEERARRCAFDRLRLYGDPALLQNEPLCYPASVPSDLQTRLCRGREIWESFIGEFAYPHDKERVLRILREEVERFAAAPLGPPLDRRARRHQPREFAILLDRDAFLYDPHSSERALLAAHHPDFFSPENIFNRVYLKVFALTRLSEEPTVQYVCLHKIFLDVIKLLESRFGLRTAHQTDDGARAAKYQALKAKLADCGVTVSDSRREEYTVALLDWDTALQEEYELFPVLEQLGDAIYGLAVAEMLFYNPATEAMAKRFEDMTCAETQIRLSRFQGLDRLYHSVGASGKYGDVDSGYPREEAFTLREASNRYNLRETYLADSLEMILGAVCRDKGADTAIKLAKGWLTEAFPEDFPPEIRFGEDTRRMEELGEDYWIRILPAPLTHMTPPQRTLWMAAEKALLTVVLGTDTVEKRRFITNSHGNTVGDFSRISWAFYEYLQKGRDAFLSRYGEAARKAFEDSRKA